MENWETDEDRMIDRLKAHRDLITWVVERLQREGIRCDRTRGNDPNGDILYYDRADEATVKAIVRDLHSTYNAPG